MTLFSAQEDLQETTLKAISGCLRKLEYVAGLRGQEGKCEHWGLVRVYGEAASNRALAEVHGQELSRVLSTPIRNLETDVQKLLGFPSLPTSGLAVRRPATFN